MDPTQAIACNTLECLHNQGGECAFPAAITIEDRCCLEYERRDSLSIVVYVEGGNVLNVYASPALSGSSVEVVDMDNVKVSSEEDAAAAERRMQGVKSAYKEIY